MSKITASASSAVTKKSLLELDSADEESFLEEESFVELDAGEVMDEEDAQAELDEVMEMDTEDLQSWLELSSEIDVAADEMSEAVLSDALATTLPSIDWRTHSVLTPVRNQGACSCCWAMSSLTALEAAIAISTSTPPVALSTEQLLSCDQIDSGCAGGNPATAFSYMQSNLITTDAAFPLSASVISSGNAIPTCPTSNLPLGLPLVSSHKTFAPLDEAGIVAALAQGPVTALMDGSQLQFYDGSQIIYPASGCKSEVLSLDHSVTIVGVDTLSDGEQYWIVQNSWGDSWGANGFLFLAYGTNTCGIAQFATSVEIAAQFDPLQ